MSEPSLYSRAAADLINTQHKQIQKGLEKYGGPLNPAEWTHGELYQHAMDELVDLMHYLQALKIKFQKTDKALDEIIQLAKGAFQEREWSDISDALHRIVDIAEGIKKEGV